jgi:hypothetical protein
VLQLHTKAESLERTAGSGTVDNRTKERLGVERLEERIKSLLQSIRSISIDY